MPIADQPTQYETKSDVTARALAAMSVKVHRGRSALFWSRGTEARLDSPAFSERARRFSKVVAAAAIGFLGVGLAGPVLGNSPEDRFLREPGSPQAVAGADFTVVDRDNNGSESVSLDASGSSDADGTIIFYQWLENGQVIASGPAPTVPFTVGAHNLTLLVFDNDGLDGTDQVIVTVAAPAPPQAAAGTDVTVVDRGNNGSESVSLDASGSSDADGTIASYEWRENGQIIASGATPSVSLAVGVHTLTLRVTDNDGFSGEDQVTITVQAPALPQAAAGGDRNVLDRDNNGSESVSLDGSGSSDADGTIASYEWRENGQVIAAGATPSVSLAVGVHTLTLRVTDNDGFSDEDQVIVTVQQPDLPQAAAGADRTILDRDNDGSESVDLSGSGSSDADGTIASYEWQENGQVIAAGATPTVSLTVGVHTLTLRVTDNDGFSDTDTVTITVRKPEFPRARAGADLSVLDRDDNGSESVSLDGSRSSDADGTIDSYQWRENGQVIATGVAPTEEFAVGEHIVTLRVTDSDGFTDTDRVTITVRKPEFPKARAGADLSVLDRDNNGSESVSLDGSRSSDADGTIDSYQWRENGRVIATGVAPSEEFAVGEHSVTLRVTDSDGFRDTDRVTITVVAPEFPKARAGADVTVRDENNNGTESVNLDGSRSTDADGTIDSYQWRENDQVVATGAKPSVEFAVGEHIVTLRVTDSDGFKDTDKVTITVVAPELPKAAAGDDLTVRDGNNNGSESVNLDGSGSSDADGTIDSYQWLENGQVVATGATPSVVFTVGVHTLTLRTTDNDGLSDEDQVIITVQEPEFPIAAAGADRTVLDLDNDGTEIVSLDGSGSSDADGTIASYQWLENDQVIATGATPTVSLTVDIHTLTLRVTDDDGIASEDQIVITVLNPELPVAAAGPDRIVVDGDDDGTETVDLDGSASSDADGNITSYQWLVNGEVIATGPTPTISLVLDVHVLTLLVTDNDGLTDEDQVIITVREPQAELQTPIAEVGDDRTVVDEDNNGTENVSLDGSGSSDADGTIASYQWLENDQIIATGATPTVSLALGVHSIALRVTDNDGLSDEAQLLVTVLLGEDHGCSPISSPTVVSPNSRTDGELERGGDDDCFRITLPDTGRLSLGTSGDTDTVGALIGEGGQIDADNDGGAGGNFQIGADLDAGTYEVEVTGFNEFTTGTYTLNASFSDTATERQIDPPSTVSEQIEVPGEVDRFRIALTETGALTVSTTGGTDTFGTLSDSTGATIAVNDRHREADDNFQIVAELEPGEYLMDVSAFGQATGPYTLAAQFAPGPPPPEPRAIDPSSDTTVQAPAVQELFCIEVPSRGTLALSTQGATESFDTLIDRATDTPIAFSSDRRIDDEAGSISVTLDPGTYCLLVQALSLETVAGVTATVGSYTVSSSFAAGEEISDVHGDDAASATVVALDSSEDGTLGTAGDRDMFWLDLPEAGKLTVQTKGTTDTVVVLRNAAGLEIARDDDGIDGNNGGLARILEAGQYFAQIEGFAEVSMGAYELLVDFEASAEPTLSDTIKLLLEEPAAGSVYSGVANIRGWAFDEQAVDAIARIELFVDGRFGTKIPSGGSRVDVARVFPQSPGALRSGYSMAFNYSGLAAGEHEIMVRAVDVEGNFQERSAVFEVASFDGPFIRNANLVDLAGARIARVGSTIVLQEVIVREGVYDLQLEFRTATQGFALTSVTRVGTTVANEPIGGTARTARADCPEGTDPAVVISLEEPLSGSVYSGVSNIRGWSVSRQGLDRIELLIDGLLRTNIPSGSSRADVGRAFPDFPGSNNSGYSMAFSYSNLAPGEHVLTVAAVASNGERCEVSARFDVARFEGPFIRQTQQVRVSESMPFAENQSIALEELLIDQPVGEDVSYDVQMEFRTATQGFAVTEIAEIRQFEPNGVIVSPADPVLRVKAGESVRFSALADGTNSPNFLWRFGDPAIPDSVETEPVVQFNQANGNFPVSVTVSDANGLADPTPASVNVVVVGDNRAPQPVIQPNEAAALKINEGQTIAFRGFGNDPDGDDKLDYHWRFDRRQRLNGAALSAGPTAPQHVPVDRFEQNPSVQFAQGGVYEVTLEVTDSQGLLGSASVEVSVYLTILEVTDSEGSPVDPEPDDGDSGR